MRGRALEAVAAKMDPNEPMWVQGSFVLTLELMARLARQRGLSPEEAAKALRWHMEEIGPGEVEGGDDAG